MLGSVFEHTQYIAVTKLLTKSISLAEIRVKHEGGEIDYIKVLLDQLITFYLVKLC